MGNDSAQRSWQLLLQFSPQSHQPQSLLRHLQLSLSSFCWNPGYMVANRIFCVGLLRSFLHLQPSLPWQTETLLLFIGRCYLGSFLALVLQMGSPVWGLDPTLLRENSPATEISLRNFSCCPWELSQPSHTSSTLPTSLLVVKWFLLFVLEKAFLQLVFSWLLRVISL